MRAKVFFNRRYGYKYSTRKGESYYFEVVTLPQVGERKSYGVYPIGGFLVKFAHIEEKKFFSYEVRFTFDAVKELSKVHKNLKAKDLKAESIKVAVKVLEQGCSDDMLVTVTHIDEYTAVSSELPLQKHRLYYEKKKRAPFL
ncbi:hypothetical protein IBX65_04915 [Candidatus Aerophobetes bacterium]|nr:hypothetical protein [Candidatus Aerophobetes bacterium]